MQLINCLVALGEDKRNTVPKKCITVAEAVLLRAIHGNDAIFDIEPSTAKDIESCMWRLEQEYAERGGVRYDKKSKQIKIARPGELDRLRTVYGKAKDADGNAVVNTVYPGVGAQLFDTLESAGFAEDHFKATARAKAVAAASEMTEDILG